MTYNSLCRHPSPGRSMEDGVLERLCVQITVMTGWISRAGGVTASGELSRTNAPERSPVGMRSVQMPNLACWSQSPGSVCSDAAWIEAKYGGVLSSASGAICAACGGCCSGACQPGFAQAAAMNAGCVPLRDSEDQLPWFFLSLVMNCTWSHRTSAEFRSRSSRIPLYLTST